MAEGYSQENYLRKKDLKKKNTVLELKKKTTSGYGSQEEIPIKGLKKKNVSDLKKKNTSGYGSLEKIPVGDTLVNPAGFHQGPNALTTGDQVPLGNATNKAADNTIPWPPDLSDHVPTDITNGGDETQQWRQMDNISCAQEPHINDNIVPLAPDDLREHVVPRDVVRVADEILHERQLDPINHALGPQIIAGNDDATELEYETGAILGFLLLITIVNPSLRFAVQILALSVTALYWVVLSGNHNAYEDPNEDILFPVEDELPHNEGERLRTLYLNFGIPIPYQQQLLENPRGRSEKGKLVVPPSYHQVVWP